MAFETYKGITRNTDSVGAGGLNLDANFTTFADRIGPCNYTSTRDPTGTDDSAAGYFKGSRWVNTTTHQIWDCVDDTPTAAVWRGGLGPKNGIDGYAGLDGDALLPNIIIPEDVRQQLVGTVIEINAATLLRGQIAFSIVGSSAIAYVGDGILTAGGLQFSGNAWPSNDVYARYDPTAGGGSGAGDGVKLGQTGLSRVKSTASNAELDQRTQGIGFSRLAGTTDSVPTVAPLIGNYSIDLQIKRAGNAISNPAGARAASVYIVGEDTDFRSPRSAGVGGNNTGYSGYTDHNAFGWGNICGPGANESAFGRNVWVANSNAAGYGHDVRINGTSSAGYGHLIDVCGAQCFASGYGSSADGTGTSGTRNLPITITSGVITVAGDLSSILTPITGMPPTSVLLYCFTISGISSGQPLRYDVSSATYSAGTGLTTINLAGNPLAGLNDTAFMAISASLFSGFNESIGNGCRVIGIRSFGAGYQTRVMLDSAWRIGGMPHIPELNTDVNSASLAFRHGSGALGVMVSQPIDFTAAGGPYELFNTSIGRPISRFFPLYVGVISRGQVSAVTVKPQLKIGTFASDAILRASFAANIDGVDKQDIVLALSNDGVPDLRGTVITPGTGTKLRGQFIVYGIYAERFLT